MNGGVYSTLKTDTILITIGDSVVESFPVQETLPDQELTAGESHFWSIESDHLPQTVAFSSLVVEPLELGSLFTFDEDLTQFTYLGGPESLSFVGSYSLELTLRDESDSEVIFLQPFVI